MRVDDIMNEEELVNANRSINFDELLNADHFVVSDETINAQEPVNLFEFNNADQVDTSSQVTDPDGFQNAGWTMGGENALMTNGFINREDPSNSAGLHGTGWPMAEESVLGTDEFNNTEEHINLYEDMNADNNTNANKARKLRKLRSADEIQSGGLAMGDEVVKSTDALYIAFLTVPREETFAGMPAADRFKDIVGSQRLFFRCHWINDPQYAPDPDTPFDDERFSQIRGEYHDCRKFVLIVAHAEYERLYEYCKAMYHAPKYLPRRSVLFDQVLQGCRIEDVCLGLCQSKYDQTGFLVW
ncbi:uncharacterized protein CTRU02_209611 [Colletotrichum truncatum]|uniref:Uncharacterized protein n=1 Tax=Colletotrichum truncatum TaxID=5467 RepID=A0ACC3YSW0_COLTU|nr:uncharacterized protein CTRU02_12088 [Colletotrichum truncatum]KAF6785156.1 hypothetical protein CTRU02_12088 [Colletotrichum truncatum]